ncbi:VOC family protein [Marinagarivorans algicola]|uniref:VOC family protein n=1 Tax=Marinagarivorans algicola TaxID=1513270 RepID=UPI0006B8A99C|nr:VOC family protein [Marinagarivorans algicola]
MPEAILEHANITVHSVQQSAALFCRLFDWKVRWQGDSIHGGRTIHVGGKGSYLALYENPKKSNALTDTYYQINGLNHICLIVSDLDDVERRVQDEGLTPINHANYEPGRRFYFKTNDNIEVEVVDYK